MKQIQYRYSTASARALALVTGDKATANPLGIKKRVLPFNTMLVGDSLFFHVEEMIYGDIMRAREAMNAINKHYDDMFVLVKHSEPKSMVEIVRVK